MARATPKRPNAPNISRRTPQEVKDALSAHYDVAVIGGGAAALSAAICAAQGGAKVIVIESAPATVRGGNTRHSNCLRLSRHGDPPLSDAQLLGELRAMRGEQFDENLAQRLLREAVELPAWLKRIGVRFQPPPWRTPAEDRSNLFLQGGGVALINALYRSAERHSVRIFFEADCEQVELRDGRFDAAWFGYRGHRLRLQAAALVVASGGLQANSSWLEQTFGAQAARLHARGSAINNGRVSLALLAAGAQPVALPRQINSTVVDARAPRFDGGIATRVDAMRFGIVVNRHAQRFADEAVVGLGNAASGWGESILDQPEQRACLIVDAQADDDFFGPMYPPIQADDLAQLANLLELDAAALARTVDAYNGAARRTGPNGPATDRLAPAKSGWARPIVKAPYRGYRLAPAIDFTYYGLRTTAEARVIMQDGMVSDNLFAAGESMAGNLLGPGYRNGFGLTLALGFGRIAGMAARAAAGSR